MARRNEVSGRLGTNFFSLQVYPDGYFLQAFDPSVLFTKYALVEVSQSTATPEGMLNFQLDGGLYAVFHHKGNDTSIFQEIYTQWLPNSEYELDNRPHFELLGEKYKNGDPNSEEEIYVPIKTKK